MTEDNMSPVKVVREIDFISAITAILDGKKVRRLAWEDQNEYCFIHENFIKINKKGIHSWIIGDGDFLANDWVVIE